MIANHALGLWQVALVHLGVITRPTDGTPPAPDLASAGKRTAHSRLVDGLGPRLGVHEYCATLTQAQMLFVGSPIPRVRELDPVGRSIR